MKGVKAVTWAATATVTAIGLLGWTSAPEQLASLAREDGAIEYATVLLYLVAALAFARAASRGGGLWRLWTAGLAALVFLVAGEEISWGQRLLGVATPQGLSGVNVQQELNLHNIDGVHQNVRMLATLFVLVVCLALPVLHRSSRAVRALTARLRLPVFPLWAVATATLAVAFMVVPRLGGEVVFVLDEVGELLLAVAMTAFAFSSALATPLYEAPGPFHRQHV